MHNQDIFVFKCAFLKHRHYLIFNLSDVVILFHWKNPINCFGIVII